MAAFLDVCRFSPTAGGTTDWTYSAAVTGCQSPASANVVNGRLYKYRAESADLSQWEMGEGAYNTGTGVLARTTVLYNSSGSTSKINFTLTPQVAIVALKEDLISVEEANSFTETQRAQARANIGAFYPPQGRLTLQSATPVMSSTQSAKTTLLYTPYVGNQIPIYDGTNLIPTTFAELSIATTDTTKNPAAIGVGKVNDWFVWNDATTVRLSHGPDWTSDTVRSAGTVLVMVNGILLNNASITNGPAASRGTYVGTTRSNASSQLDWIVGGAASGGTAGFLGVWNCYNRVSASGVVVDSGAAYPYSSTTIRQARASAGNQASFVLGLQEDAVSVSYAARSQTIASTAAAGATGVGLDSTSVYGFSAGIFQTPVAVAVPVGSTNSGIWQAGVGFHFVAALESSDGSSSNTFDAASNNTLSVGVRM